jgi:hypothetical protein
VRRSLMRAANRAERKIGDLVHPTEHRRPRQNEDRRHRGRGAERHFPARSAGRATGRQPDGPGTPSPTRRSGRHWLTQPLAHPGAPDPAVLYSTTSRWRSTAIAVDCSQPTLHLLTMASAGYRGGPITTCPKSSAALTISSRDGSAPGCRGDVTGLPACRNMPSKPPGVHIISRSASGEVMR